ncbi:hypothetical protein XENORESO_000380 [Xenotaenia resolanae]|uniref:Transmembrane protein n=1 Tax=Xenotaenia resolanae TaxID=208358 RepID=A0ABV0WU56_9TELE
MHRSVLVAHCHEPSTLFSSPPQNSTPFFPRKSPFFLILNLFCFVFSRVTECSLSLPCSYTSSSFFSTLSVFTEAQSASRMPEERPTLLPHTCMLLHCRDARLEPKHTLIGRIKRGAKCNAR